MSQAVPPGRLAKVRTTRDVLIGRHVTPEGVEVILDARHAEALVTQGAAVWIVRPPGRERRSAPLFGRD